MPWAAFGSACLLLLGLYLRLRGADGDLWLDELVTLEYLSRLGSPLDLIWGQYFDNSHPLNSLYLYFLTETTAPQVLRGFSIFCGGIAVVFAGLLGLRRGPAGLLIYAAVFALSYPFIHFSSEARGYASLMAFWTMALYLAEPGAPLKASRVNWLLPPVALLGLLSHLFFLVALTVLALWHIERRMAAGEALAAAGNRVLNDFRSSFWPVALLFASMVWAWQHFGAEIGALPTGDALNLARDIDLFGLYLATLFGLPAVLPQGLALVLAAGGLLVLYLLHRRLAPERARGWRAFYLLHIFLVPLLFLKFDQLRYQLFFAGAVLFFFADGLTSIAQRVKLGPWICAAVLVLFGLGQLRQVDDFLRYGRGAQVTLLQRMAQETAGPEVTFGGFHAMAEERLLAGAARWLPSGKTFNYVGFEEDPDWLLLQRGVRPLQLCPELELRAGPANAALLGADNAVIAPDGTCPWHIEMPFPDGKSRHYRLEVLAPYWGLSGMHTAIFRRVPAKPAP